MTTIVYQLPENIGQNQVVRNGEVLAEASQFPAGTALAEDSIPVVFPRSRYALPVIDRNRTPSEVSRDHLGIPRVSTPQAVVEATDQFEIRSQDWIQEISGIDERPDDGVFSARWTQLQNTVVVYDPLPDGDIQYDSLTQSARLGLNRCQGGFQRVRLSTRNRFRYQVGRITRVSLGVEMSVNALESCTKTWGIGDARDGYFFQIQGDGAGDNFRLIYRSSAKTGLVREVITPRSEFNGDKLDGTGNSRLNIRFDHVTMFLVEWGWYGGTGAKFYAYVVDSSPLNKFPRSRWVLCHEMLLPDKNPFPTLQTPSLPITVELANSGSLVEPQYLKRFGASVLVDGGTDTRRSIQAIDANIPVKLGPLLGGARAVSPRTVLILDSKDYTDNGQLNVEQVFPLVFTATATADTEILFYLDPVLIDESEAIGHNNGEIPRSNTGRPNRIEYELTVIDEGTETTLIAEGFGDVPYVIDGEYVGAEVLSSTEVTLNSLEVVQSGKLVASYFVGADRPINISLSNIFQLVRERLSTEYDTPFEFPTTQEDYRVVSQAGTVLNLNRKHRLYQEQRIVVGTTNYYVFSTPSEFSVVLGETPTGPAITLGAVPEKITAFFDLEFSASQTQRGIPIYQSRLVVAARTLSSATITATTGEANAQWIQLFAATSSNTYIPVNPPDTLNYSLILGVN